MATRLLIFAPKKGMLNTVIFDMDGLLIDSEPLWQKAGMDTLKQYGIELTWEQYYASTGLRTPEWIEYWFLQFGIDPVHAKRAIETIENNAISYIGNEGAAFAGTSYILKFFRDRNFRIGLATSSPMRLVDVVVEKLGISQYFDAVSSAENLRYGKPHPQVYLDCAETLSVSPLDCVCFEDSFNGVIAAKAARMKCVVVPLHSQQKDSRWAAADLRLSSLQNFNELLLAGL